MNLLNIFRRSASTAPTPITINTIRTKARAQTAPVTALRDATTAALAGRPDASVDYTSLVKAWRGEQ